MEIKSIDIPLDANNRLMLDKGEPRGSWHIWCHMAQLISHKKLISGPKYATRHLNAIPPGSNVPNGIALKRHVAYFVKHGIQWVLYQFCMRNQLCHLAPNMPCNIASMSHVAPNRQGVFLIFIVGHLFLDANFLEKLCQAVPLAIESLAVAKRCCQMEVKYYKLSSYTSFPKFLILI